MRKKGRGDWSRHPPPWGSTDPWGNRKEAGRPLPRWGPHSREGEAWHASGPALFLRFAIAFGLFVLLGCGLLALLGAAAMFVFRALPSPLPSPSLEDHPFRWIFGLLGAAFLLALILRRVGVLTARRFTEPLSETMKAADALSQGDLSARVPVDGSREFRHFARSFNRMAETLEIADRQRRELLADVAHELRTPLAVIQGNLEGLRDGIYEASPEHLDLVLDETYKLSRLVEDLRLLTLAEAGQLNLDIQELDVRQLLVDVRDTYAYQASEAEIPLALDLAGSLPALSADPQRLGQVLGNLLTNALRHTQPGGAVTLGAAAVLGENELQLWVSDTGEGISPDDLARIFDRFWRGDVARSRATGAGSGLGLAIAKSLVEAHGGRIWAESELGVGTTVTFLLPLSPPA